MNILLTNDDGIDAPGLEALRKSVSEIADIMIVAPETEMSAVGHAITLSDPLQIKKHYKNDHFYGYAVNGTPADCVKIGYWALLRDQPKPDLLISGINQGSNTGINIIYSGTVSAATEGAILGIPSIAISLTSYESQNFKVAAGFARDLAQTVIEHPLPDGVFLNVNVPGIPEKDIQGVRITKQGRTNWVDDYHMYKAPNKREYYWLIGERREIPANDQIDDGAIEQNKISITPIHYDLTYYPLLEKMKTWDLER